MPRPTPLPGLGRNHPPRSLVDPTAAVGYIPPPPGTVRVCRPRPASPDHGTDHGPVRPPQPADLALLLVAQVARARPGLLRRRRLRRRRPPLPELHQLRRDP